MQSVFAISEFADCYILPIKIEAVKRDKGRWELTRRQPYFKLVAHEAAPLDFGKIRLAVFEDQQLSVQDAAFFGLLMQITQFRHFWEHFYIALVTQFRPLSVSYTHL